jgi:paraquat-inducible protein B
LSTQSLLTGQLYVDLDLRPGARPTPPATADGLVEIPTRSTPLQTLQAQLEGLDLGQLVRDLSATAASMKQLVASPQLKQALEELAQAASGLKRLGAVIEARVGPLANAAQGTLAETRRAAGTAGAAAERLGGAADRIGAAAGRVDSLLSPGSPVLGSVQRAADELARSATALRQATAEDAPVVQSVERAAQDVARASRAVRELAELLERQPDALIRGRPAAP